MTAVRFETLVETLRSRNGAVLQGGGEALVKRHKARGKIPVRDRVDLLLDIGSPFLELSPLAAHGIAVNCRLRELSRALVWFTTRPAW